MTTLKTPITEMLGMTNPIMLAGMNKAAGPDLAAAVSNHGGLGVVGGVNYSPRALKILIRSLKRKLNDPNLPFGVDLLLPKVGEGARATNYDYTKGKLDKLIDVVIESGAKLFVSAVGVPPKRIVDKLHDNGILCMNMVGHPKHVKYALAAGMDIICAQGGEGGGHTGHVPTSLLIPACVDACKGHVSPLTGKPVYVVAAGGIYDGRGLAMSLCMGAQAVWVGTRFVASVESGASHEHKAAVVKASYDDTYRTLVYTGRPMRIIANPYATMWEKQRGKEMKELLAAGVVPYTKDQEKMIAASKKRRNSVSAGGKKPSMSAATLQTKYLPGSTFADVRISGSVCGAIDKIEPASVIMDDMIKEAVKILTSVPKCVAKL